MEEVNPLKSQPKAEAFPLARAIVGGVIGAVIMAMWAMMVAAAIGMGIWAPVQLIAIVWYGPAAMMHLQAGVIFAGLMTHMMMGAMLGIGLAVLFHVVPQIAPGRARLLWGVGYGLAVWLVSQFVALPLVDPMMASHMAPWAFALGHMMFGLVAAAFLLGRATAPGIARTTRTLAS